MVTSAGSTHEKFVLAALAARKPVFCEKPLATTVDGCRRIVDAEIAIGKRLVQVGFMRRFDPAYRAMRRSLKSGAVGSPLFFHSVHRNPATHSRFESDMIFNDVSVHDIDIARWLLQDEVSGVSVYFPRRNTRSPQGLQDPVMILLEMKKGTLVDIELSVNVGYGYDIRGEISGESGSISLSETNHLVMKSEGAFRGSVMADWRGRFDAAFEAELREWIEAAAVGSATGPSSWDGYVSTLVADTALKAANNGRLSVSIPARSSVYDVDET
jgi:myo-inositol 2-dehydrogenase/D-chiro-inositol 1-dehydrogenase